MSDFVLLQAEGSLLISPGTAFNLIATLSLYSGPFASAEPAHYTDSQLQDQVQIRAVRYFHEKADPLTGLVNDRASNFDKDDYTVASIAATGYGLASLPIAVERHWISRKEAMVRAKQTLRFLLEKSPRQHGWFYHFVNVHNGERVWKSEISSIDTALLIAGARICGQYFRGSEAQKLANVLEAGVDWHWMLTDDGKRPDKLTLSHGWTPEKGFLPNEWDGYSEASLLYLLGLGAQHGIPAKCWPAWPISTVEAEGQASLTHGPIFMHQMVHGFFDLRNRRDRTGVDYAVSSTNATLANRLRCMSLSKKRRGYGPDIWGLNASDGPRGYKAYGVDGPEDGTISTSGSIASVTLTPVLSLAAMRAEYDLYGEKLWGRFGFANAFNPTKDWYDTDVIGIDLGMALLALENHRSGLIWRLMASHPATVRAMRAAGFHTTKETGERPVLRNYQLYSPL